MFVDTTSYSLLKTLQNNPDLSQRDLAKRLGVSLGKINFCLNKLVEKGCLKVDNFRNSDNKLAYAYLLTPHGIEQKTQMTVEFLQIKMQEYERLRVEIAEFKREVEQLPGAAAAAGYHRNLKITRSFSTSKPCFRG